MDWKKYTPSGCRWTKPFSSGSGTCIVELQLWYKWDSPNTTKRTIKFYSKLVLSEYAYYLQVNSAGATRTNQQTGYTMRIGINGGTMVDAKSSIYQDPSWGQASTGVHNEDLCSTSKVLSYNNNGKVSATIDYDLYMKWYSINQGSIKSIDAKGSYKVSEIPSISTTDITSIALTSNSISNELTPSHVSYTNISNIAIPQTLDAGQSKTFKAVTDRYVGKERTINFTIKPADATGNITITTSNSNVASPKTSTIDVSKTKSFVLNLKQPGNTKITLKSDNDKSAVLNCTLTSRDSIGWTSSNNSIATISNGTVQAKNGVNGYTLINAFPVGNTSASNQVQTNVLLPPTGINIISNKNSIYPGETIGYTVTVQPYSATNTAIRVASNYRGTKYEVDSKQSGSSTDTILNNGSTMNSNQYNVNYSFNNFTLPTDYVCLKVNSTYKTLTSSLSIPVKAPTLDVDKTSINVVKGGASKTITITTMPESYNSAYSYTYDSNYINVSRNNNVLTVTGKNDIDSTPIKITGTMPTLPNMTKPTKTVTVRVGSAPLTKLSSEPTSLSTNIGISKIAFTNNLVNYYSDDVKNTYGWNGITNHSYQIPEVIDIEPKTVTFKIKFEPFNASDTIYVTSTNENIVTIPTKYQEIYTGNGNGNGEVECAISCLKAGNASLLIKNEDETVTYSIPVTCTLNTDVTMTSSNTALVSISDTSSDISESGLGKSYDAYVHGFNGTTNITVKSKVDTTKYHTLPFNCWLIANAIDLSADKTVVYAGDTITFTMQLQPYSTNPATTVAKELSYINYKLVNDRGIVVLSKNSIATDDSRKIVLVYTIPTDNTFKDCDYFKLVASWTSYVPNVESELKIRFKKQGVSIDDDSDLLLATTKNSFKNYVVNVSPSTESYKFEPEIIKDTDGYTPIKNVNNNNLKIVATDYRNLTVNGQEATKFETAKPFSENTNVNGKTLKLVYDGPVGGTEPTSAQLNIYTCEYFNKPKIINAIPTNSDSYFTLNYYGDKPKFVFELPNKNDFNILNDIIIRFSNNDTYTISNSSTAKCFSGTYSIDKHNHTTLTSMIIDYTYSNDNAYITFVPTNEVPNGRVTITYKSAYPNTIPNAEIYIDLTKKSLEPPKVGDYIELSYVKNIVSALETVLTPYYNGKNILFEKKSISDVFYGVYTGQLSSIGVKGESISSMPFFKILFGIYNTMDKLSKAINVIGSNLVPQVLDYTKNRLMLTTDKTRSDWYSAYVGKRTQDNNLANDYSNLFGIDIRDSITTENYPIMADDSNDYVGLPELEMPNEYKDTNLYNDYTISPLTEIIKALQQF